MARNTASFGTLHHRSLGSGLPVAAQTSNVASAKPWIFAFFEVRDSEPGVRLRLSRGSGEDEWTEYPESRGVVNSYSDSRSD
jgi:hypothetical protein